jgi:hypothetical protein
MRRLPFAALTLAALAAFAACCVAWAQTAAPAPQPEQLGKVTEVRGLVTMSLGSRVATVQPQTPVYDGARFVAGSSGKAELRFDNGCVLRLEPNEWVTIDRELECKALIATIHQLDGALLAAGTVPDIVPLLTTSLLGAAVYRMPNGSITPTPR